MPLAYTRLGRGQPLLLLHGIGLSRDSWQPVLPDLIEHFDVLAVDLPGFGASPPLPDNIAPSPARLANAVAGLLRELDIEQPHVVGNSLGGWVALELAHIHPIASITLLSPAGFWRKARTPRYCRVSLRATKSFASAAPRLLAGIVGNRVGRYLVMRQSHGRPKRMTREHARTAIRDLAASPGFVPTMRATADIRYVATSAIDAPVTVAFGSKDLVLLRRQSRHLDQLPPHTSVAELPGCGHVPMTDDPDAVAALIHATAATTAELLGVRTQRRLREPGPR
jgi:pimeloyl-ACP methyl ester carboxylesterase